MPLNHGCPLSIHGPGQIRIRRCCKVQGMEPSTLEARKSLVESWAECFQGRENQKQDRIIILRDLGNLVWGWVREFPIWYPYHLQDSWTTPKGYKHGSSGQPLRLLIVYPPPMSFVVEVKQTQKSHSWEIRWATLLFLKTSSIYTMSCLPPHASSSHSIFIHFFLNHCLLSRSEVLIHLGTGVWNLMRF